MVYLRKTALKSLKYVLEPVEYVAQLRGAHCLVGCPRGKWLNCKKIYEIAIDHEFDGLARIDSVFAQLIEKVDQELRMAQHRLVFAADVEIGNDDDAPHDPIVTDVLKNDNDAMPNGESKSRRLIFPILWI